MEPVAAKRLAKVLPAVKIEHNTDNAYWCDPILRIGATPDTIAHDPERGLGTIELKNPHPYFYARNWVNGEPPLWMALQVLTAAKLMDAEWAAVGALRVGHKIEFDLTEIPLHDGAWQALLDAAGEFWRCVETDTPPVPNYKRDLAVIAAMYPQDDGTTIDLSGDNELINALVERERVKEMIKAAQDNCDAYDALIKHKAGPHETHHRRRLSLRAEDAADRRLHRQAARPTLAPHQETGPSRRGRGMNDTERSSTPLRTARPSRTCGSPRGRASTLWSAVASEPARAGARRGVKHDRRLAHASSTSINRRSSSPSTDEARQAGSRSA